MCTHMRAIRNIYTGQELYVPCGRCDACLQEKANRRASRIRAHCENHLCLFITLTYDNSTVPYIKIDDLLNDDGFIPVYRDVDRFSRLSDSNFTRYSHRVSTILDEYQVPKDVIHNTNVFELKHLRGQSDYDKIGVCYYKDVINFVKKLRQNLKRRFNYEGKFSYFFCTEYGPTTSRPHVHGILFCDKDSDYSMWKSAVSTSWTYDDSNRERQCEIARKPASYVASYVNSNKSCPPLLRYKVFKAKSSYSLGLGHADYWFQLDKILEAFQRGDLLYPKSTVENGVPIVVNVPYPSYILHRFFPKIKGYYRLTSDEIVDIYSNPKRIHGYKKKIKLDTKQAHEIEIMLCNRHKLWQKHGYSIYDFAYLTYLVGVRRSSNMIKRTWFDSVRDNIPWYQQYDNVLEVLKRDIGLIHPVLSNLPNDWITDPNKYPFRILRSDSYSHLFALKDKSRKLNNYRDCLTYNV